MRDDRPGARDGRSEGDLHSAKPADDGDRQGLRGHPAREMVIKQALYGILKDEAEVERIFLIIKGQREY